MDGAEGICAAHRQEVSFFLSGDAEQPLRLCACTSNVLSTLLRKRSGSEERSERQKQEDAHLRVLLHYGCCFIDLSIRVTEQDAQYPRQQAAVLPESGPPG